METTVKHHWKSLANPDYIGAYTLMATGLPVDLTVKIKSVAREMVTGADGKKDECTVAQLDGHKPFIINATNAKTLTKLFDSPFIEDWVNKPFTLFVSKVKVAGDTVDALRIRPTLPAPKALPDLNPSHAKWEGALTAIQAGNTTIEEIRKRYSLTAENEALLTKQNEPV